MVIKDFLDRLLGHMGIEDGEVSITEEDNKIFVQISVSEDDSGLLIGYHGDVLASLQRIAQLIYRDDEDKRIIVNVNDYKQRREAQLAEMVSRIAFRVLESGEEYVFDFLPANERLVVHTTISNTPDFVELESISLGDGNARRLHLRLKSVSDEVKDEVEVAA